jgi:hypothetical protein
MADLRRIGRNIGKCEILARPGFHRILSEVSDAAPNAKTKGCAMYLKKVDGPRAVTLPDGSVMTRADLPPPETRRWVASRKAAVVKAVAYGLMTLKEALDRYQLSEEEFDLWRKAVESHGEKALKVTAIQKYRQV